MDEPQPQNPAFNEAEQINNELLARTITDEQGYERRIYDLNSDVLVSFRGLYELPTMPTDELNGAVPTLVTTDEAAPQLDSEEFNEYLGNHANQGTEKQHLIASATPIGIIDLAQRLRSNIAQDLALKSVRDNLVAGTFGQPENSLLDMMSAALFTNSERSSVENMSDGLMDVVLALNGDETKQTELAQRAKLSGYIVDTTPTVGAIMQTSRAI